MNRGIEAEIPTGTNHPPCTVCKGQGEKVGGWHENGDHWACVISKATADECQLHWAGVVIQEQRARKRERIVWASGVGVAALLGAVIGRQFLGYE